MRRLFGRIASGCGAACLLASCGGAGFSFGSEGVKTEAKADVPKSVMQPGRASFATEADMAANAALAPVETLLPVGYRVSSSFHKDGRVRFAFVPRTADASGIIDANIQVGFDVRSNIPFPIEGSARIVAVHPPQQSLPMQVAVDVDGSGSMRSTDSHRRRVDAAVTFAERMAAHDARHELAVFEFATEVQRRSELTSNLATTRTAIEAVGADGSTLLDDSLITAIQYVAANRKPEYRQAVLLLTDGMDTGSEASPEDVVALAQRENITIYALSLGGALDVSGLGFVGPVQVYAAETGGIFAHIDKADGLIDGFTAMALAQTTGWVEVEVTLRGLGGLFVPFSTMTITMTANAGGQSAQAPPVKFVVPLKLG